MLQYTEYEFLKILIIYLIYNPKAIRNFVRAVPSIVDYSVHRASQMSFDAYDNRLRRKSVCDFFHCSSIRVIALETEYVFQKIMITTYAQLVASEKLSREFQQVANRTVRQACRQSDCSRHAIVLV